MLEVGRKILRNSLDVMAYGCYAAALSTTRLNIDTIMAEVITGNIGYCGEEIFCKCGKKAIVPSAMLTMGLMFKGISKLI